MFFYNDGSEFCVGVVSVGDRALIYRTRGKRCAVVQHRIPLFGYPIGRLDVRCWSFIGGRQRTVDASDDRWECSGSGEGFELVTRLGLVKGSFLNLVRDLALSKVPFGCRECSGGGEGNGNGARLGLVEGSLQSSGIRPRWRAGMWGLRIGDSVGEGRRARVRGCC